MNKRKKYPVGIVGKRVHERRIALEAGNARYFTGKPCKNGHVAERETKSGSCIECTFHMRTLDEYRAYAREAHWQHRQTQKWKDGAENRRRVQREYSKREPQKFLYKRAKARATARKQEFTIEESDCTIPQKCPVFDEPFIPDDPDWAPSLDRLDSSKGYIKGNVAVVSRKANLIKNYGTATDHDKIAKWMFSLGLD